MTVGFSDRDSTNFEDHDFLFTWKHGHGYEPGDLVKKFRLKHEAQEPWSCSAHKKIHAGHRAYLLKQGGPIGIFGRGTVIDEPRKDRRTTRGEAPWKVLIGFEVSRGDVLCDPDDEFLVDGSQLLDLPVPRTLWKHPASGITLPREAARAIYRILDSILIGRSQTALSTEDFEEVARQRKKIWQAMRPNQQSFSDMIRRNYRNRCAITGCVTSAVLEAHHISIREAADNKRSDDNSPSNGILLRRDIHGLFDELLITLSEDGTRLELSPELIDSGYKFLKTVTVDKPETGASPSAENIRRHRKLFLERRRHPRK